MGLGRNDFSRGEKEIRRESSDLSYLHNSESETIQRYESHLIVPSQWVGRFFPDIENFTNSANEILEIEQRELHLAALLLTR